jgi:arylsulfatase A-like enzyme
LNKTLSARICQRDYVKEHLDSQLFLSARSLERDDAEWQKHTLVVLTSDHGMSTVSPLSSETFDHVTDILENTFCGVLDCDDEPQYRNVVLATNGGMAHIYIRNRETEKKWSDTPRLAEDIEPALRALLEDTQLRKFVDAVLFRPSGPGSGYRRAKLVSRQLQQLSDSGYDQRRDSLIQKLDSPRSGDVLIVLKDGYYFDDPEQYPGNHGGLAKTDLHIPLILAGPGIRPGKDKCPVSNTQVAATVYRFLTGNDLSGTERILPINSCPSK